MSAMVVTISWGADVTVVRNAKDSQEEVRVAKVDEGSRRYRQIVECKQRWSRVDKGS